MASSSKYFDSLQFTYLTLKELTDVCDLVEVINSQILQRACEMAARWPWNLNIYSWEPEQVFCHDDVAHACTPRWGPDACLKVMFTPRSEGCGGSGRRPSGGRVWGRLGSCQHNKLLCWRLDFHFRKQVTRFCAGQTQWATCPVRWTSASTGQQEDPERPGHVTCTFVMKNVPCIFKRRGKDTALRGTRSVRHLDGSIYIGVLWP